MIAMGHSRLRLRCIAGAFGWFILPLRICPLVIINGKSAALRLPSCVLLSLIDVHNESRVIE